MQRNKQYCRALSLLQNTTTRQQQPCPVVEDCKEETALNASKSSLVVPQYDTRCESSGLCTLAQVAVNDRLFSCQSADQLLQMASLREEQSILHSLARLRTLFVIDHQPITCCAANLVLMFQRQDPGFFQQAAATLELLFRKYNDKLDLQYPLCNAP